jgi:archaellin
MKTLAFFFVLMVLFLEAGEPLKFDSLVINGREYETGNIVKVDEITVLVTHSSGSARIPIASLSADLQKSLGYDPAAAKKFVDDVEKSERERKERAKLNAIVLTRFWVSENLQTGLVVGNFTEVTTGGGFIGTSGSRTGNGGGGYFLKGKTTLERADEFFFIPHNRETRSFVEDHEFLARVLKDGTYRLDSSTVVTKFKLVSLEKALLK